MDKELIIFKVRRFLFIGVLIGFSYALWHGNTLSRIVCVIWLYILCATYADKMLKHYGLIKN